MKSKPAVTFNVWQYTYIELIVNEKHNFTGHWSRLNWNGRLIVIIGILETNTVSPSSSISRV